ncbi:unnamed protein product [Cercopithifilaria johnstoni]|uniref:Uncharacterized protein n=1 Tax=Cercopithifilaria johnstoni TaxID=2874296 RepID=A0A8J2MJG0_9BILA|nr:unnamed protein product [Cercopithifilaria johnstoni]
MSAALGVELSYSNGITTGLASSENRNASKTILSKAVCKLACEADARCGVWSDAPHLPFPPSQNVAEHGKSSRTRMKLTVP